MIKLVASAVLFLIVRTGVCQAATIAKIIDLKGDVSFDGKPVVLGATLESAGTLKTGAASFVKVAFPTKKAIARLNAGSSLEIKSTGGSETVTLLEGLSRWLVTRDPKKAADGANAMELRTRTTAMGVRGTNFLASFNPLLGESEIICFEGLVNFSSLAEKDDNKNIKAGQWGGLGGRFGAKIGPILDLPPNVLAAFSEQIPLAAELAQPK